MAEYEVESEATHRQMAGMEVVFLLTKKTGTLTGVQEVDWQVDPEDAHPPAILSGSDGRQQMLARAPARLRRAPRLRTRQHGGP